MRASTASSLSTMGLCGSRNGASTRPCRTKSTSLTTSSATGATMSATSAAMTARGIASWAASSRVLHEHDAAGFLDGTRAERAVRAAAGKDHGEAVAIAFGERAEEHVDGRPPLAHVAERSRGDLAARDHELAIRRDDVDAVRRELEVLVVADLEDAHFRAAAEDRGELALVVGREMHDDDVRHAEIGGNGGEERPQCVDATGRSTHSDDGDARGRRHYVRCHPPCLAPPAQGALRLGFTADALI